MRRVGVYVLASLISGVSAALILANGPSYIEARSPQGTAYNVKRGQSTYNGCRTSSPCQIAHLSSVEDFCLWAPLQPALSAARDTEHTLVAWCMKSAHGTHLIPDGTILGARFVITPEYVQITGVGNLTNINVPADSVASASGGDRVHGLVFTRAYGQLEQIYDWTSFVSQERFCFRACKPSAVASTTCPRIYDSFGCSEDAPGDYNTGVFEDCIQDATEVPFTLHQEVFAAPSHHSTRPSSGCTTRGAISNVHATRARRAVVSTSGSTSSTLVTSFSHLPFRSHGQSTPLTSSISPTTTDIATTITFPSLPASMLTATSFTSSSTPVSSATSTSTLYSYSYTHTHTHSHSLTYRHSRHRSSTSSASVSSSSRHSFAYSQSSSSTASPPSPLGDPSTTSSTSSPATSTSSFTLTFSTSSSDPSPLATSTSNTTSTLSSSTYSSSDPSSSAILTSSSTPTPLSTSTSTSSFPSSSGGTSSSLSGLSSAQPSTFTPSSTATLTSSLTSPSVASLTSAQSSDVLTFTTSLSSSSVTTTSSATSSATFPNSQTQIGSQCPPASQVAVNAGSVVSSPTPLLPLMLTILMIVISSSVGILVA